MGRGRPWACQTWSPGYALSVSIKVTLITIKHVLVLINMKWRYKILPPCRLNESN